MNPETNSEEVGVREQPKGLSAHVSVADGHRRWGGACQGGMAGMGVDWGKETDVKLKVIKKDMIFPVLLTYTICSQEQHHVKTIMTMTVTNATATTILPPIQGVFEGNKTYILNFFTVYIKEN